MANYKSQIDNILRNLSYLAAVTKNRILVAECMNQIIDDSLELPEPQDSELDRDILVDYIQRDKWLAELVLDGLPVRLIPIIALNEALHGYKVAIDLKLIKSWSKFSDRYRSLLNA